MGKARFRTPEAARYLGLAAKTLEKMRSNRCGPPYFRIGHAVIYDEKDLEDWLDRYRVDVRVDSAARANVR
jgi:predicted DNA-binding transcriptional regulator AlpA